MRPCHQTYKCGVAYTLQSYVVFLFSIISESGTRVGPKYYTWPTIYYPFLAKFVCMAYQVQLYCITQQFNINNNQHHNIK